jgi:hypothetical protein
VVRKHCPQPSQRLGGNARAKLRDVALQVCADEVLTPAEADRVVGREEALREAASDPERVELRPTHLSKVERRQFHEGDPSRERLARLGQQRNRGGAQQQEASGACAFASAPVDDASKRFEKAWCAMDLVEDHELVGVVGEVERGLGEACPIGCRLEVQICGRPSFGDTEGERGLAGLSRANQSDRRQMVQQRSDLSGHPSLNHPCNYKAEL